MRYVAFLRAINVGGHTVAMAQLKSLFEGLDLARVETFLASGNVIFESPSKATAALERRVEQALAGALGYEVATFLRTDREAAAAAEYAAFPAARVESAGAYAVAFMKLPPAAAAAKRLKALENGCDEFHVHGREVYWLCRTRQSESTFSNAVLEKTLGAPSTLRGLSTVRKLAAKYPPRPSR